MLKGLTMVVLPVSDWAKSREWYTEMLGLTPIYEMPEDAYGEYSLGDGCGAALGLWGLPKGYSVVRGDGAKLVAPLPYIEVEKLDEAVAALKAKGVEFDQVLDDGEFKTARFRDPDGHVLFLYELVR